jgi:hypothetical protein
MNIFGRPKVRRIPSTEFEILCYPTDMVTTLELEDEELLFRQRIPIPPEGKAESTKFTVPRPDEHIDAGALTREFLSVKSPEQALTLLDAVGRFRYLRDKADGLESVVTWHEFQLWQELVNIILTENHLFLGEFISPTSGMFIWGPTEDGRGGPDRMLPKEMKPLIRNVAEPTFEWLSGRPHGVMFTSQPDSTDPTKRNKVSNGVITDTAIDSILASIFVDTVLCGIQFELCSFPDCPNVYEVTSNHQRDYCSHACAHKASMRRRRAKAKADRESAKARKASKKAKK